jgi:hypothetical protein
MRAIGKVAGGTNVVNEPVLLTVRPDSLTPIILNEYVVEAVNPVSFTEAVVGAPPSTIPGRTGAVAVAVSTKVGLVPYSKLKEVGANPGFTSIKTSAD